VLRTLTRLRNPLLQVTVDGKQVESRMGFCALFAGPAGADLAPLTTGLGERWEIQVAGYILKPYPCGAPLQRAIDAILALRARHRIDPAAVKGIRVGVSYSFAGVLSRTAPATAFTDERVRAPEVRAMMARVRKYIDPALERGAPGVATDPIGDRTTVTVVLDDGRELAETVRFARGSPENPMSRDELLGKYRECARLCLDERRAGRALGLLERLDTLPSVRPLMDTLRGVKRAGAARRV
jgi:2-methylcitrate dehydratase PrpD